MIPLSGAGMPPGHAARAWSMPDALAWCSFPLRGGQRDAPAALEEHVPQPPFEGVEPGAYVVGGQGRGLQPHAAVDVVADGLGDQRAGGAQHGADRYPGTLVQVRREHDPRDGRG
jgi:hypothetical protein